MKIPTKAIKLDANIREFDPLSTDMIELKNSLAIDGLLQPISVYANEDGTTYTLVFGNRRFHAACDLGWEEIDATIIPKPKDEQDRARLQFAENTYRQNMTRGETARYLRDRKEKRPSVTLEELARDVGKSVNWVKTILGLGTKLADEVLTALDLPNSKLTVNTAEKLAQLPKAEQVSYLQMALDTPPETFDVVIKDRIAEIKQSKNAGVRSTGKGFEPRFLLRKPAEIQAFITEPAPLADQLNVDPAAVVTVLKWVGNLDDISVEAQRKVYEEATAERERVRIQREIQANEAKVARLKELASNGVTQ